MRYMLVLAFCVMAVCSLTGCNDHRKEQTSRERPDVVDRDFVVSITNTSDPLSFDVEIKKVNPKVDKLFGMFGASLDLVLTDASGHVLRGQSGETSRYLKIDSDLTLLAPGTRSIKRRGRLLRKGLKPGDYTVRPVARILECGRDAVRGGRYADGGSVAIPSGNSVKVRLKEPWLVQPLRDHSDAIDRDFVATIAPTGTLYVYEVEVKRVNKKADKWINGYHEVFVDLELADSSGRILAGDFCIQTFAEYVGDGFGPEDLKPHLTSKKGRVRLVTSGLPAGRYTIKPVVRIPEEGKDRIANLRADLGSVVVPAANATEIVVE